MTKRCMSCTNWGHNFTPAARATERWLTCEVPLNDGRKVPAHTLYVCDQYAVAGDAKEVRRRALVDVWGDESDDCATDSRNQIDLEDLIKPKGQQQ